MKEDLLTPSFVRRGVLDRLRAAYPQETWRTERDGFGWRYVTASGWRAEWRACLAPRYDGDDDSYVTRMYIYRPGQATLSFL